MKLVGLILCLALAAAACGGDGVRPVATTVIGVEGEHDWEDCEEPIRDDHLVLSDIGLDDWDGTELALIEVAAIPEAIEVVAHPDSGQLFVTTQKGELMVVEPDGSTNRVLDLRRRVSVGEERGLLGVTFAPDGVHAYLSFTDTEGSVVVEEYGFPGWFDRREVLLLEQPERWHNGGHMEFGPDGYLYMGLGDGGNIGDPDRLAQDRNTLYGSIIRIDPSTSEGYEIPEGNPFGDGRAEIVAYGLRNPWQFSFDSETGDLWIGDVGQNCWEEIDRMPAGSFGQNFGWSRQEGPMPFRHDLPADYVAPVLSYDHSGTCAVTGGVVYRGSAIPDLVGMYVFADYCRGQLMAMPADGSSPDEVWELGVAERLLVSFGVDGDGELLIVGKDNGVFRLTPAP